MKSDFIGGAIAVAAAFASIFGVNLQKYSHDREELRAKPRPYHLRPLWWVGMVCVVGASLGDFLALAFASQSLVASLGGGSTILGNCLLSRFWLKQALYITDIVGVIFVTFGVVTLAAASVSEPGHYKMGEIYDLMVAPSFIVYGLVTTAFVLTLYLRVRRSKAPALRVAASSSPTAETSSESTQPESVRLQPVASNKKRLSKQPSEDDETDSSFASRSALMSPFPSPIYGDTPRDITDEVLDEEEAAGIIHNVKKMRKYHGEIEKHTLIIDPKLPLYWAAISGTIGAQSMLLAKCVAEMISSTVNGDNQFVYFGTYVIIGAMVATLLTQTHTFNLASMAGDTMSSYPVFQAFWISMSNISGIVFFQQTSEFTSTQWMLFPSAIVLVVLGMTLIAKHEKFGNRVKYTIAMPIILSSDKENDIVAQSFVFRESTPQHFQDDEFAEQFSASPRRRRASVDVV